MPETVTFSFTSAFEQFNTLLENNLEHNDNIHTIKEHLKNLLQHMQTNRFTFFGLRKYFDRTFAAKEKAERLSLEALNEPGRVGCMDDIATILWVHCLRLDWFKHKNGHTRKLINISKNFFYWRVASYLRLPRSELSISPATINFRKIPFTPASITGKKLRNSAPSGGKWNAVWKLYNTEYTVRYEGEWKDGVPHGNGCFVWSNGHTYQGEVKNGLVHGKGHLQWEGDNFYKGEFSNNYRHGQGHFHLHSGYDYQGQIIKGRKCGYGQLIIPDKYSYKGLFREGSFNGHGMVTWPDKRKYEGSFNQNNPDGSGCFTWPDGTQRHIAKVVDGRFRADIRFANGVRITGWFDNGMIDNSLTNEPTTLTLANGQTYQGTWVKNYLYSEMNDDFIDPVFYDIIDNPVYLPVKQRNAQTDEWEMEFEDTPIINKDNEITGYKKNGRYFNKSTLDALIDDMKKQNKTSFSNPLNRDKWTKNEITALLEMEQEKDKNDKFWQEIEKSRQHVNNLAKFEEKWGCS